MGLGVWLLACADVGLYVVAFSGGVLVVFGFCFVFISLGLFCLLYGLCFV